MEKAEEVKKTPREHELMIATIGSKNRVCLPPNLMDHLQAVAGEDIAFLLGTHKSGRSFAYIVPVKLDNFAIDSEEFEKIEKSLTS